MVARGSRIPERINPDAIIEAVLELRFNAPTVIPEVLYGRMSEVAQWKSWQQRKLPSYEIPAPIREADLNLRFQPVFELNGGDARRAVRVGPHVLSYHLLSPYPGWDGFRLELESTIDEFFGKAGDVAITRLGFRYLNALTAEKHGVRSLDDLDLLVEVGKERQSDALNLNFSYKASESSTCTIRIATRDFVQGAIPNDTVIFVDVDLFTREGYETKDRQTVKQWVGDGHETLRQEFFHLLTEQQIKQLEAK